MATLTFENYFFEGFSFTENEKFDIDSEKLDINIIPKADIYVAKDKVLIKLSCKLGDDEKTSCPFTAEVDMVGIFGHTVDEDDAEDKLLSSKLVSQNTLAILFPYLRSFVSDMTLRSNKFPAYIIPTMNIVDFIENTSSVNIIEVNDEE